MRLKRRFRTYLKTTKKLQKEKDYTSARNHKRIKRTHQTSAVKKDSALDKYLKEGPLKVADNEDFNVINYWQRLYYSQPDLARFALDVLTPPPMSDKCKRLFSSCKILLEDRRSRLKMDIIEANEWLRHSYGPPRSNTFDDKGVGSVEGEPQPSPLYDPTPEQLREYIKERQAADVAAAAAAQVEEEDTEEDDEVLAMIERAGGKGGGDDEDEGNDEDAFETIEAFEE